MKRRQSKFSATLMSWMFLATLFYRIDFKPSDFYLFCRLKHQFDCDHYNNKHVVKTVATSWLSQQDSTFFEEDIQNQVVRYDACLNKHGSYVAKQKKSVGLGNIIDFWKFSLIWFLFLNASYLKNEPLKS